NTAGDKNTGIINNRIDTPKNLDDLLGHSFDLGLIADICIEGQSTTTKSFNFTGDLFQCLFLAFNIINRHVKTAPGHANSNSAPYPPAGTRYQYNLCFSAHLNLQVKCGELILTPGRENGIAHKSRYKSPFLVDADRYVYPV